MNRLATHLSFRWGEMLKKQCAWKNLSSQEGPCSSARPARASHLGAQNLAAWETAYLATLGGEFTGNVIGDFLERLQAP